MRASTDGLVRACVLSAELCLSSCAVCTCASVWLGLRVDVCLVHRLLLQVNVAEVMANDDKLDGEWDLAGEKAKGSIKLRLK